MEAAAREESYMGTMRNEVSGYLSRGASQVRELTHDREGATVLIAFGAGVGLGLLIGGALAGAFESRPQRWTDRIAAEGIGRRMLDRIESILPEALAERVSR
jgi:hypothetical protein